MKAARDLVPGEHPEFEVLVCSNDDIALGAMEALSQKGILIPKELAHHRIR